LLIIIWKDRDIAARCGFAHVIEAHLSGTTAGLDFITPSEHAGSL